MSHVLLGGDERKVASLSVLLTKWGVTSGPLAFAGACPSIHDCDVVILVDDPAAWLAAWPDTLSDGQGGAAGPAAPLIFINGQGLGADGLPPQGLVLPAVDADGTNLRLALRSSLARARSLRGEPDTGAPGADPEGYLHFLGHELRSPLTAIKTSLEVLEGDLGGLDPDASADPAQLKMLGIALRNVRRLHRTVEWSQDLLAGRNTPVAACRRETAVPELAARLLRVGEVRTSTGSGNADVVTDPDLVENVVVQMGRAVSLACPDQPLVVRLEVPSVADDALHIAVGAADGEHALAISPERTRLVPGGGDDDTMPELERLGRFMVAAPHLEALGASLEVDRGAGEATLVLALPALRPAPVPTD